MVLIQSLFKSTAPSAGESAYCCPQVFYSVKTPKKYVNYMASWLWAKLRSLVS